MFTFYTQLSMLMGPLKRLPSLIMSMVAMVQVTYSMPTWYVYHLHSTGFINSILYYDIHTWYEITNTYTPGARERKGNKEGIGGEVKRGRDERGKKEGRR